MPQRSRGELDVLPRRRPLAWDDLQTRNERCARVLARLRIDAVADKPVLLLGEDGTGKLTVCHAIHLVSPRAKGPFVVLHPGPTPAQIEAAVDLARHGSLVVREPSLFTRDQHARLAQIPESRLLITSSRTLSEVDSSPDAFDVLCPGLRIGAPQLPPLRQRPEDVLPLFDALAGEESAALGLPFEGRSEDLTRALLAHPWPGNLRELREAALHAVLRSARAAAREAASNAWNPTPSRDDLLPMDEVKRRYIQHAASACEGNLAETARRLHVSENTVAKFARP